MFVQSPQEDDRTSRDYVHFNIGKNNFRTSGFELTTFWLTSLSAANLVIALNFFSLFLKKTLIEPGSLGMTAKWATI